jgi:methionyl-tRNA formyltransferase
LASEHNFDTPIRALFLGRYCIGTAAVIASWLDLGHEIAGLWCRRKDLGRADAALRWLAPGWSIRALLARAGLVVRPVPPLRSWSAAVSAAAATDADVIICAYFPFVVPLALLERLPARVVNLHPALLPHYRGPDPLTAMLLARTISQEAAATLHVMSAELDAGEIIAQESVEFPEDADMVTFRIRMAHCLARLTQSVPAYLRGEIVPAPQDAARATYARIDADRELVIGLRHTFADALWLSRTARSLRVAGAGPLRVGGPCSLVGRPTGRPPVVRRRSIECDVADARSVVRRLSTMTSKLKTLRFCLRLGRSPVPRPRALPSL